MTLREMALACADDIRFDGDGGVDKIEARLRQVLEMAAQAARRVADETNSNPHCSGALAAEDAIRDLAKELAK
jgi:hypothetical protein